MSAGMFKAHIIFPADQLHCLQQTRIYVGWHDWSAHNIPSQLAALLAADQDICQLHDWSAHNIASQSAALLVAD